jgi:hypothetical protein
MNLTKTISIVLISSVVTGVATHGQATRVAPAVREAVPAVLELLTQYPIVALSEGPHNNQKT